MPILPVPLDTLIGLASVPMLPLGKRKKMPPLKVPSKVPSISVTPVAVINTGSVMAVGENMRLPFSEASEMLSRVGLLPGPILPSTVTCEFILVSLVPAIISTIPPLIIL